MRPLSSMNVGSGETGGRFWLLRGHWRINTEWQSAPLSQTHSASSTESSPSEWIEVEWREEPQEAAGRGEDGEVQEVMPTGVRGVENMDVCMLRIRRTSLSF